MTTNPNARPVGSLALEYIRPAAVVAADGPAVDAYNDVCVLLAKVSALEAALADATGARALAMAQVAALAFTLADERAHADRLATELACSKPMRQYAHVHTAVLNSHNARRAAQEGGAL